MSKPTTLDMAGADKITLPDLVERLADHGVTVPNLDNYRRLKAAVADMNPPILPRPADLLSLEPKALLDHAQQAATRTVIGQHLAGDTAYMREVTDLDKALDEAMRASIRNNISSIIADLRGPFDISANVMRTAVQLGIKPSDDMRSLFQADEQVRTTWLSTHAHARTLDQLFTLRQALSFQAGVEPSINDLLPPEILNYKRGNGTGINWAVTISNQADGAELEPYNPAAPWQRWLKIAPYLELTDPSARTQFETLRASNQTLADELLTEAHRREAAAPTEA